MGYIYLTNRGKRKFYIELDNNNNIIFVEDGKIALRNGAAMVLSKSSRNADGSWDFDAGKAKIISEAKEQTARLLCKNEVTAEEVWAYVKNGREARLENIKRQEQAAQERADRKHKACEILIKKRLAEGNGVLESNVSNIFLLLQWLNTQNWGGWELPTMTIGYSCNQYDCDGRQATTIKLDTPININGSFECQFQVGAPIGHLRKYRRIVDYNTQCEINELI